MSEEPAIVFPFGFSLIHGQVRMLHQGFGVISVQRENTDANSIIDYFYEMIDSL